ncbi:MAG: hypothetical protein K1W19_09810 [Lachnospiraceae bacterium]
MVYCNLVSSNEQLAVYNFGMDTNDLSGSVTFYKDSNEPEVTKLPKEGEKVLSWLWKLNARYRKDFSQGIFKEKLSYECG